MVDATIQVTIIFKNMHVKNVKTVEHRRVGCQVEIPRDLKHTHFGIHRMSFFKVQPPPSQNASVLLETKQWLKNIWFFELILFCKLFVNKGQ